MSNIEFGPLIVFFLLLLITLSIRIREGTWYSPFSFFGLLWTFIIGFSIFTAPEYYFSINALGFITINIFVFFAGGLIAQNVLKEQMNPPKVTFIAANSLLRIHFYTAVVAGFLALFFLLHDAGIRFAELLGSGKLMDISKVLTNNRYEGERLSGHTMICLTICYSGCLTAGRFLISAKGKLAKMEAVTVLLPLLLFTLIYTARAIFIFAILLFLSSMITNYVMMQKRNALLFSKRNIVVMGIAFIVLPLMFIFTQAIRMGISKISIESFAVVMDHLKVYFSGNMSAFSYWFDERGANEQLYFGAYTFAGLNEWIGGDTRALGIYGKAIDLDGHMQFSNIYTLFRFLVDDFGITGTILIWFLLGICSRIIYNKLLSGDAVAGAALCGVFTWMLFSFVTSVFAYNSVLFSWLLYVLITFAAEKFTERSDEQIQKQPGIQLT
ncbi:N/A [soil metagenome]